MDLRIDNLTISYEHHPAVHHLTASINKGDWLAIVGPNGAGKSTLLNALAGVITDYEGDIVGLCPNQVAYLPQQNQIDKSFPITVFDPPPLVPGLIVTYSLIVFFSPINK